MMEIGVARSILYDALNILKEKSGKDLEVFETAIRNVSPVLKLSSRRVGGATYQVPVEVSGQRVNPAIRWIVNNARKRGENHGQRLAGELLDAANNTGLTIKKKEDTLKWPNPTGPLHIIAGSPISLIRRAPEQRRVSWI